MLISQTFSWPTVNWPTATAAAAQYSIYQLYPGVTPTFVQSVTTNSATLAFDDTSALIYQVRPSSGIPTPTSVGPECAVFVVGYVPCRAWLRNKIRKALADRTDTPSATLNWPDDELNEGIQEALTELNVLFPLENTTRIVLLPKFSDSLGNVVGVRQYPLPTDFFKVRTCEYVTSDEKFHRFMKEKPWRGGETTAQSVLGYPKLGVLYSPPNGRFYPGNYFVYQNQLNIDWDPDGDGEFLNVNYLSRRPIPTGDGDILALYPEDMELISLRTQMKCWLRVESQDTRLSRWRSREDGSKRDDMPTLKHSDVIKRLYNELVHDRREQRPRSYRLVRR